MKNRYGDADVSCPTRLHGVRPGYLAYVNSLAARPENPSVLILADLEPAVLRIVRACGAILGPVYHLADTDHAAIQTAVARLEAGSPVLAITGDRIFLTTVGENGSCPYCRVLGPSGAAGWPIGKCPVLAGRTPACACLLTGAVLAALHVLIDSASDRGSEGSAFVAQGYSINLSAVMPDPPRSCWGRAALTTEVTMHRGHA